MIKILRWAVVAVALSFAFVASADKPDPRIQKMASISKEQIVISSRMVPLDDADEEPDAGFVSTRTIMLQVSEKWMKLPLDKQRAYLTAFASFRFDGLRKKEPRLVALHFEVYRDEGAPGLGMADISSEGIAIFWEPWYTAAMMRREAK
jgi:hypothetical protein